MAQSHSALSTAQEGMVSVVCRICGQQNPAGASVCRYCGAGTGATPPLGLASPAGQRPRPSSTTPEAAPVVIADEQYRPPSGQGWASARSQRAYTADATGREGARSALVPARPLVPPAYPVGPAPGLKDPGTGLILEMLPAFFGFYGIGYLWAGEIGLGLALLFGNWTLWFAFGLFAVFFSVFTFGFGLLCLGPLLPLLILLYAIGPVISGLLLQQRLRTRLALAAGR